MTDRIGQQLSSARLAKNLSIDQVAKATRLRAHAIAALEADDFESFPSSAQARGFLRIYAEFLGLSLPDMFVRQRAATEAAIPPVPETSSKEETEADLKPKQGTGSRKDKKSSRKNKSHSPLIEENTSSGVEETPEPFSEMLNTEDEIIASPVEVEPFNQDQIPDAEPQVEDAVIPASQAIFNSIGEELYQRRQTLSISLDEIEKHIHVPRQHLKSLETGQISELPSSVQARGMISNYAHFLDLDVDAILSRFADGLQARLAENQQEIAAQTKKKKIPLLTFKIPVKIRRLLTVEALIGLGVLILLVILATWGTGYLIRQNAAITPAPSAPSISNILLSSTLSGEATSTAASTMGSSTLSPEFAITLAFPLPTSSGSPVQIILLSTRSVWVKVTVDNVIKFTGRTEVGLVYVYEANTQIEVVAGDGSAVSIIYNQADLGPMGGLGELVDRIYTATAILMPTLTSTPTPTITLTPTITPRPTATSRYSPTPDE